MSVVAMLSGIFMAFVVEKQGGKSCEREEAQLLSRLSARERERDPE